MADPRWQERLRGSNYSWAADTIRLTLKMGEEEAAAAGGYNCYKKEFLDVLYPFLDRPCFETAVPLLEMSPSLYSCFDVSCSVRILGSDAGE